MSMIQNALLWIGQCILTFAIGCMLVYYFMTSITCIGQAMEPSIGSGDQVLVSRFTYSLVSPKSGDVVVMDNLRSHHVQGVKEAFDAAGIQFLYLPPYSPDLNPIEKMWSKMKAILRKWKERSADRLPASVADALKLISATDCLHWFTSCSVS